MSVSTLPEPSVKRWRVMVFGVVAVLLALVFLVVFFGAPLLLSPWIVLDSSTPTYHAEIHLWHDSVNAAFDAILVGGSLIDLVWRARNGPCSPNSSCWAFSSSPCSRSFFAQRL